MHKSEKSSTRFIYRREEVERDGQIWAVMGLLIWLALKLELVRHDNSLPKAS